MRTLGALALALALTACSSGPGEGDTAAPERERPSTTTTPGGDHLDLHGDVVVSTGSEDAPVRGTATTAAGGKASPRSDSAGGAPTAGSTPTAATTTTTTTLPAGLPPEKCPEPKTCRRYRFTGDGLPHGWRAGPDAKVTIHYLINPSNATSISAEEIEGAIRAAFDTWERAAPTVRFVYDGRTTMQAVPGDGVNVIAFNSASSELTTPTLDNDGAVVEFDMQYGPDAFIWAPCRQADGSCTPHDVKETTGSVTRTRLDLQSIATHAAGHALWLGDMDINDPRDRYLTMFPDHTQHPPGSRFWSTLALGDVLGVRALYPCSCPLPPIYDP